MPVKKPRLYGISNSRLLPLALAWSPESELDIHSPPSPSSGVEGGRLLENTNRLLDSCIDQCISQTQRKVSHTHTHTPTSAPSHPLTFFIFFVFFLCSVSCVEHRVLAKPRGTRWALFGIALTHCGPAD